MKNIKLLKPQPSPKNGREPLANITNCFPSRPKSDKDTHRSPSHSPRASSRITQMDSRRVLAPKAPLEAKFMQLPSRCLNHREKQGRFRVEGDPSCLYCENCAVELSQKGRRLVTVKPEDACSRMVGEARQYLKSLEEVMERIGQRRNEARTERYRMESRYSAVLEDIQREKMEVLAKINEQYQGELLKLSEARSRDMGRLQEEQEGLLKLQSDFSTIREDVSSNMESINIHIDSVEFREIMSIYWEKIATANEKLVKESFSPVVDSTQVFISKYLPPQNQPIRMTFQENIRRKPPTPIGKEFTFNKLTVPNKCQETYSWELSEPSGESAESIVQERIKIK